MKTISISPATKQTLRALKQKMKVKSFNAVLEKLINKNMNTPRSMFGSVKGIGPWKKETDRMKFKSELTSRA